MVKRIKEKLDALIGKIFKHMVHVVAMGKLEKGIDFINERKKKEADDMLTARESGGGK